MSAMPNGKPNFNGAFSFVVDPVSESTELTDHYAKVLKKIRCCGSWKGVTGAEHTPSSGEYMRTLQQASGFMFLGPNRFLGYLGPEYEAGLDAPKCSIAFLLDRIAIDASSRRQMKNDNGRTKDVLALGRPMETAVLLTLAGVRAVVLNQWALSPGDACAHSTSLFKAMSTGMHVAAALQEQRSSEANASDRMRYNCIAYGIPFLKP